tara:strand:+ start:705 stop:1328 length:624 start_codon:yes stop_codon:yes gene_type:complete
MGRMARFSAPNNFYHVTQRGNYRQVVFESDEDKEVYMGYFQNYALEFGLKLYAWCLMSNHVHFIVKPLKSDSLEKAFGITHMRYSRYFNIKKGAKGQLWQGRFYSCPLEPDHLYEAIRYVELNPYRAKMVSDVAKFYWSSSHDRLHKTETIRLSCVKEYIDFPNWRDYLEERFDQQIWDVLRKQTKSGKPLGSEEFTERINTARKRR